MSLVLDAGGFLAIERDHSKVLALIKREHLAGRRPLTHGGVVAQVWRGGRGRQALLAGVLAGVEIAALDGSLGRRAGVLLSLCQAKDAIDAAVICLARDGDEVLTSDPRDLRPLAEAADLHIDIVRV